MIEPSTMYYNWLEERERESVVVLYSVELHIFNLHMIWLSGVPIISLKYKVVQGGLGWEGLYCCIVLLLILLVGIERGCTLANL